MMLRRLAPGPVRRAAAFALALAACGPVGSADRAASPARPAPKPAAEDGYLAPPGLGGALRSAAGLAIRGQAPAGSLVRLAAPDGAIFGVAAGLDGRWSLTLPIPASPAMFALSAQVGPRTVRSEGAVLALPEPGPPALLVRAGFAALPLGQPGAAPTITAIDYDAGAGGGAAVAGLARPLARVRLSVDGIDAGLGQADELGHFAVLAANRPLAAGERRVQVETDAGRTEVGLRVSPPAPLGQAAYRATRQEGGWRIDWTPAGGGVQTTVVFDLAAPRTGSPAP